MDSAARAVGFSASRKLTIPETFHTWENDDFLVGAVLE
jgi:hypothetical protein